MMRISLIIVLGFLFLGANAQKDRALNRKGIKDYNKESYSDAEVDFLKSLEIDSTSIEANYNLANALYRQERYEDAGKVLSGIFDDLNDRDKAADVLHNLGNNLLKQEMYEPSIEAFKNSLKLRPTDEDTRYNLAYAKAKLQQQEQQQQQQDQNQDQNQEEDKDQEQNQDQQNKEQENKDQEEKQDQQEQDQQQQNENENQDQQQQQQQQKPIELSKEDMERLLQAIAQQEKDVKEKLEKKKAAVKKVKSEKDW